MPDQDVPIGDLRPDEELAQEELDILEEAAKLADDAAGDQDKIQEEVERIQQEHPNLVFEPNPNLIGNGVQMSPELLEWAYANSIMSRIPQKKGGTKAKVTRADRVRRRKMQKKSRKKNRRK